MLFANAIAWVRDRHRRLFVLDYLSFVQDRELLGIYRTFDDAIEALSLVTLGKTWREGDQYSIFEVERERLYEGGLSSAVFSLNLYGPTFRSSLFERLYHEHCKTRPVPREVCF